MLAYASGQEFHFEDDEAEPWVVVHHLVGFARDDVRWFRVRYADGTEDRVDVDAGSGFVALAWVAPWADSIDAVTGDVDA